MKNNELMNDLYTNSLRIILKGMGIGTAKDLAQVGGLELSTACELAEQLCAAGEFIAEADEGAGTHYRFNAQHKLVLVLFVVGKDRAIAAVSDLYGNYLEKDDISVNPDTLEIFDGLVAQYKAKYPAISALAFGLPGFEESRSGRLLTLGFPKLEWVHFRDYFEEKYGLPVIMENEPKSAVLSFYEKRRFGEGKCAVAIYVPSHCPGAAICIDGKIYRGRDNAAGEVIFLKTPVRWRHFESDNTDYSKLDDPLAVIADIALPLVVCFNPDCLVIYSLWMPPDSKEKIRELLLEFVPREFLPDIEFIPDIAPDAIDGLIHLALKELEPKVDFSER